MLVVKENKRKKKYWKGQEWNKILILQDKDVSGRKHKTAVNHSSGSHHLPQVPNESLKIELKAEETDPGGHRCYQLDN